IQSGVGAGDERQDLDTGKRFIHIHNAWEEDKHIQYAVTEALRCYNDGKGRSYSGSLQEACEDGRLFSIANQAAVTTSTGLGTSFTGLAVGNPSHSKKNIVVHKFGYALSIAGSAAGAVGIMKGETSLTASLTPSKRLSRGTESIAVATAGQTIIAPVLYDIFASYGTEGTDTGINLVGHYMYDLDGSLTLEPGDFVASYTLLGTTSGFLFSFLWEEVNR
ncbi:hypothetical protein LCGC14_2734420, partial [marine sediment metagenome]